LTRQRALIEVALASPKADLASLRAAHERVLASEQDLEQIIDGLLTLTRSQAGPERREPLDLAALTTQALRARETPLASRALDLHATLEPAPTIGDPRLIERLIANLIDNAIRHNTPDGHLYITTGTSDQYAIVRRTGFGGERVDWFPSLIVRVASAT
jgi:signal transduction histidine kinase